VVLAGEGEYGEVWQVRKPAHRLAGRDPVRVSGQEVAQVYGSVTIALTREWNDGCDLRPAQKRERDGAAADGPFRDGGRS